MRMKKQILPSIVILLITLLTTQTSSKNTQVRKTTKTGNQIQVEIQSIKKGSNGDVKRINSGSSGGGGSVVINHGTKNSEDLIVVIETDGNTNSNNNNMDIIDDDDDDNNNGDGSGNIFHKVTIGLGPNSGISITHSSGRKDEGVITIDSSSLQGSNKNKRDSTSTATIKKIKSSDNDRSSSNSIVLESIDPKIISTSINNNDIKIKASIKASSGPSSTSSNNNNNENRIIIDNIIDKSGIMNENDILASDKMDKIFQSILKNLDADLAQMKNTAIQKKFLSLPCVDIDPITLCQPRVRNGECYSNNNKVRKYMTTHCKNSCDLCNTLLTLPSGIPQRIHFKENKQQEKKESTICVIRLKHVESSMNKYVETLHSHVNNTIAATKKNKKHLLKIQPCFNKYDQCMEWSILGFCELYPNLMKSTCGPACHMCHEPIQIIENYYSADQWDEDDDDDDEDDDNNSKKKNTKNKKNNKSKNKSSSDFSKYDIMSLYNPFAYSISTPFLRGDLYGIFEAIEKNLIVKGWSDMHGTTTTTSSSSSASTSSSSSSTTTTTNNNKKSYHERFASMDIYTPRIFKPEKQDISNYDNDNNNKNKILSQGNSEPTIIQLNDFLTKEECNYLLALVKEQEQEKDIMENIRLGRKSNKKKNNKEEEQ